MKISGEKKPLGALTIVIAAVLIEIIVGIMYYTAQNIIQDTMERLVRTEMNAIYLGIRNKLIPVEVTVKNTSWVVGGLLDRPERMPGITKNLVEHNPSFLGSGIAFVPGYYSNRKFFEPYSVRRSDGSIELMQLGSDTLDYMDFEYFRVPIVDGLDHWSNPYLDEDGARTIVTTFGVPVTDAKGNRVAVAYADISLEWLKDVLAAVRQYKSTRRYLTTGSYKLLSGDDDHVFRSALAHLDLDEDKDGYVIMEDEEGKKAHVFFHPIGGQTDWILISVLYDDEVFGTLRTVRLLLLVLVIFGLLVLGYIVHRARLNAEQLQRVNTEKARIDTELRVANEIQQSMLPNHKLHLNDVDIYGRLVPAREVGGDLYDYFVRDEKLFFCIGDVSGKGAASAMLMAVTHSLFRSASIHETNPARIVKYMNEASASGNEQNMFVTLFVGVLDLPTGILRYCNAGHDRPIHLRFDDLRCTSLECDANLPVGVFEDTTYTMQEDRLEAGSMLFLYTDGLTEAKDSQRQQFGMARVEQVMKTCAAKALPPKQLIEEVSQAVRAFVGGAEQSDDLTMLAIHYTPSQFDSKITETLTLKNDVKEVSRFSAFIKSVTERLDIDSAQAKQLRLAIEEAVVNVIDYAYPVDTEGEIDILIQSDGTTLRVRISDSGVPFDPTAKEKADTSLSAEDRQIGGLGILLVRELMDTINYERMDGKNILTLIKKIK